MSATILGINPGTTQSAWVTVAESGLWGFAIEPNDHLLARLRDVTFDNDPIWGLAGATTVVIEQVASYGMPVGAEVFETVRWAGRFEEAAHPLPVERITRLQVKIALCHDSRAKDANIRAALIDRYGGPVSIRKGGPLFGVSKDVWAALAVAVAYQDGLRP